jgi:hypothetical protein
MRTVTERINRDTVGRTVGRNGYDARRGVGHPASGMRYVIH